MKLFQKLDPLLRRFSISILTFLITFLLLIMLFTNTTSLETMPKDLTYGIYDYSESQSKANLTRSLTSTCNFFDAQIKSINQQPEKIKEDLLKNASNPEQVEAVFEIAGLCGQYKVNLTDREFFVLSASSLINSQLSVVAANNPLFNFLNILESNLLLPLFLLLIILSLLFLFYLRQPKLYLRQIGKIMLKLGLPIVIFYLILNVYIYFNPIDTTPIMELINFGVANGPFSGQQQVQVEQDDISLEGDTSGLTPQINQFEIVKTLLLVMFVKIFPLWLFVTGLVLVIFGIAVKRVTKTSQQQVAVRQ